MKIPKPTTLTSEVFYDVSTGECCGLMWLVKHLLPEDFKDIQNEVSVGEAANLHINIPLKQITQKLEDILAIPQSAFYTIIDENDKRSSATGRITILREFLTRYGHELSDDV